MPDRGESEIMHAAALKPYPIDVEFPDISRYREGNAGVDFVHTFDSGRSGPHVMVNALTHGNEVCGAIAVAALLESEVRPVKGKLTLSFSNVDAYQRFDPERPDAARFVEEDLNRVWSADKLEGSRNTVDLQRARELRPVVDEVDYLLDLHSMHEASSPLLLSGLLDKGIAFASRLGYPACVIVDAGHSEGRRLRDYGGFGLAESDKIALLVECGQHWEARSVDVARDVTARFLRVLGTLTPDALPAWIKTGNGRGPIVRVTDAVVARSARFSFIDDFRGLERIREKGTLIATDGDVEIRTPYDDCVLIMPSLRQLRPGVTVVRLGCIDHPSLTPSSPAA
jgi:predicted deacylase